MAIKMLVFDVRDCEREFFENNKIQNFDIKLYPNCLNEETINNIPQEELDSAMAISVFLDSTLTEKVISSFKNLRIISTRSSSIEHINRKIAEERNIDIVNVEGYSSKTAAQFTIGLIIALVRCIIPASKFIETGKIVDYTGYDISKYTIGVIGTGLTGATVCKIAQSMEMKVLAYDVVEKLELINCTDTKYVDFDTLIKQSDIITIHLPYNHQSPNLISKPQFDMMKNSSYLINTSRPEVVNLKDLYNALLSGKIAGCGLDMRTCTSINPNCAKFSEELKDGLQCYEESKIVSELVKLSNVIITPHIAYKTADVIEYILQMSIRGILDCIKGGSKFKAC